MERAPGLAAILLVGLGGFLGAVARFLVGVGIARWLGTRWPWGTFLINLSGCFLIGFFVTLTAERIAVGAAWRYLFPIGFVGAYTTFSTYELEIYQLIIEQAWGRALSYLLASTLAGLGAVALAVWVARRI